MLLLSVASSTKLRCPGNDQVTDYASERGLKKVLETLADGVLDEKPQVSCECAVCPCGGTASYLTKSEIEKATKKGSTRAVKEEVERF